MTFESTLKFIKAVPNYKKWGNLSNEQIKYKKSGKIHF